MVGSGCVSLQLPLLQDLVDWLLLLRERHDDVTLTLEVNLKGFVTFFLQVARIQKRNKVTGREKKAI